MDAKEQCVVGAFSSFESHAVNVRGPRTAVTAVTATIESSSPSAPVTRGAINS